MHVASTVLLVIHVLLAVALVGVVLMQRSEGGGLGMGGQSNAFMSVRAQGNLLSTTTMWLAGLFILTSIVLAWLATQDRKGRTFMQSPPAQSAPVTPGQPGMGAPPASAPPAQPPAPTGPQAPTR